MVFVDSNIPMYLVGSAHPNKETAEQLVDRCFVEQQRLVSDAEVFQEILHRYISIGRPQAIQVAFDVLLGFLDQVFPLELPAVDRAKEIVLSNRRLSARGAIHLAVMEQQGITKILTFDSAFDHVHGIERIF